MIKCRLAQASQFDSQTSTPQSVLNKIVSSERAEVAERQKFERVAHDELIRLGNSTLYPTGLQNALRNLSVRDDDSGDALLDELADMVAERLRRE